jgi:hypothetical protein
VTYVRTYTTASCLRLALTGRYLYLRNVWQNHRGCCHLLTKVQLLRYQFGVQLLAVATCSLLALVVLYLCMSTVWRRRMGCCEDERSRRLERRIDVATRELAQQLGLRLAQISCTRRSTSTICTAGRWTGWVSHCCCCDCPLAWLDWLVLVRTGAWLAGWLAGGLSGDKNLVIEGVR